MQTPAHFLLAAARDFGERIAAVQGNTRLSYAQLHDQACALATRLKTHLHENRKVALAAPNSLDYLVWYWAIQLAGGTSVELSSVLGESERQARLNEAEPALTLPCEPGDPMTPLNPEAPSSTASIVFTSGTTGTVKGVLLSRANLAWITPRIAASFDLERGGQDEIFSAFLPFCHTYGKSVVHVATWMGGCLLLDEGALEPDRWLTLLNEGITHLSLVPFTARLLLAHQRFSSQHLPELRRLTVAGGALTPTTLRQLMQRFPGKVQTMYGLTEASTRVTCMPVGQLESHSTSCGLPLDGVELKVASDGEVLVRGPNVMQGYLGQPEAGFRDGWLLTGDLGSMDSRGYLTIKGRLKNMIKSQGETVNPLTVERALETFSGVSEAAVRGAPHPERGESIVAFVVSDGKATAAELQAHCSRLLGEARVPHEIHFVGELPRTDSGKLRRHLLAAQD